MLAVSVACAVALAVSACGDSSEGQDASGSTVKIGLLTSIGGPASAGFVGAAQGLSARLTAYREDKGKCADKTFELIKADDQSTAQGALTGMQKLIQQDKVYAVLDVSAFFYGASQFATTAGKSTPVLGGSFDGAKEWKDTKNNLIPYFPVTDFTKVYETQGKYFKSAGATKVAGVSYNSPSSQGGLESTLKSIEAAGLKRGYVNNTVAFGSTNVSAIVLGIIKSKADAVNLAINADTAFAVVAGLRQAGYKTKAILSSTGYGADILESAPAVQIGQDVTFLTAFEPSELKTPATERLGKALREHAGSKSGIPSFSQGVGWLSADLFLHGLEKAGCDATQAKFLSTLRTDKTWDGGGLFADPFDFSTIASDKQCTYFVRLKGKGFVPEPNAVPLCGDLIKS